MPTLQWSDRLALDFPAMVAALARHLRSVGYNPLTGQVNLPHALPSKTIQGCGGATCSPAEASAKEDALAI